MKPQRFMTPLLVIYLLLSLLPIYWMLNMGKRMIA